MQPLQQPHWILGLNPNIHLCEEKTALKENQVKRDLTTEKKGQFYAAYLKGSNAKECGIGLYIKIHFSFQFMAVFILL